MNPRLVKITLVLVVTLAILRWMRGDYFDFDVRSVIPFMQGEVTLYDWGGLALILLGVWGYGRLHRESGATTPEPAEYEYEYEEYDDEEDPPAEVDGEA